MHSDLNYQLNYASNVLDASGVSWGDGMCHVGDILEIECMLVIANH